MSGSIVTGFEAVARRQPDATALLWRGSKWTYGDLARGVESVRAALYARNVERGTRVALLLRNSPQYVALYYGVLASGCVVVPLNAQERAGVLARQIEHAGAGILFADKDHPESAALSQAARDHGVIDVSIALRDDARGVEQFVEEVRGGAGDAAAAFDVALALAPETLATLIYTSGTTGRPKGVMLSHGNLAANAAAIIDYLGIDARDRGLCVLPFHFSYGNSVLHSHLLAGAQLVLEDNFAFPQMTMQRMQDEAVTGFAGVPSTFALMLGRCQLQEFNLQALRYVTQAGGPMPRPLIERLRQQLPQAQLFIMYGQTEATARLTYLPPQYLDTKLGSVGVPLAGVDIKVFDTSGSELPSGQTGEICARGPNVMLGYWQDPAASQEALRGGWLHTADLGHKDEDGFLYIDGRSVEMIKVGAFRVSPQEVEEVIAALPGVEEVGVTSIADELLGQAIKAVIVPRSGADLDMRSVKAHCRVQLAAYKVPKVVEFALALPRTSSGKIQRFKLA